MNSFDILMEEHILRKNKGLPTTDPRYYEPCSWSHAQAMERERLRLEADYDDTGKREED